MENDDAKISAPSFFGEYHGHTITHLERLYPKLRRSCRAMIWTAGDSSLDNKYWFNDQRRAIGAYGDILVPPVCNADVTYWINALSENKKEGGMFSYAAINTAVEATTLNERTFKLRAQDAFLRDNIQEDDILVVSIGGNDVALSPTPCTILSILGLLSLPTSCIENSCSQNPLSIDDYCCGCCCSLASCSCAFPPCFGYMVHLFGTRVQKYIERITEKTKPRRILVCMIYYPDENRVPSWANPALGALGYNSNPLKLQMMIRKAFVEATASIHIAGSEVIPVPLFNVLDGKNSEDYIARVEPSSQGGKKMAEYLLDIIDHGSTYGSISASQTQSAHSYTMDRS